MPTSMDRVSDYSVDTFANLAHSEFFRILQAASVQKRKASQLKLTCMLPTLLQRRRPRLSQPQAAQNYIFDLGALASSRQDLVHSSTNTHSLQLIMMYNFLCAAAEAAHKSFPACWC